MHTNVRLPILATSVQEQLETGSKSTADVVDEPPQVNTLLLTATCSNACCVCSLCFSYLLTYRAMAT